MFVRLILAGGMHAGRVAEIKHGFYLVGRDQECQIRSESDSVGEKHCLLQHEGKHFRVRDLDSGSPTYINHQQLEPKTWVLLNHGDMLQVGRIPFLVAITAEDPSLPAGPTNRATAPAKRIVVPRKAANTAAKDFAISDTAEIDPDELAAEPPTTQAASGQRWKDAKNNASKTGDQLAAKTKKKISRSLPPEKSRQPVREGRSGFVGLNWETLLAVVIILLGLAFAAYTLRSLFDSSGAEIRVIDDLD
jgi:pSer/pThr/pTyr-binding forkhead associated (FHA) protein